MGAILGGFTLKDKITGVIFISLALFFLINAMLMPFTTEYGKYGAPGIVPIVLSVIVILLNLIMMLRKKQEKAPVQITNGDRKKLFSFENKRFLISVIFCLTYVLLLGHLNFIALTSVFVSVLSLIFYRKKPILVILTSVLVTYGIYYIFQKLFLLPLP